MLHFLIFLFIVYRTVKKVLQVNKEIFLLQAGDYEIEIGGIRYPADVKLNSPVLPAKVRRSRAEIFRTGGPTQYEDRSSAYDYGHDGKKPFRSSRLGQDVDLDADDDFDDDGKKGHPFRSSRIGRSDNLDDDDYDDDNDTFT